MKRGPFSKDEMNNLELYRTDTSRSLNIDQLAQNLNRSVNTVTKKLAELGGLVESQPTNQNLPRSNTAALFARTGKGSVIMTEAAAMASDEENKKYSSDQNRLTRTNCIYRPNVNWGGNTDPKSLRSR